MSSERLTVMGRVREVDRLVDLLNDARGDYLRGDGLTADFELGEVGADCDPGGPGHDDVHIQLWSGGESEHFRAPMLLVRREDMGQIGWTDPADLVELLAEHGLCRSPEGEEANS